ncbi:hypothetical protein BN1723_010396 [Verticillium longisporum]|uniref:Uncharacterized protein n=1 Tax=Verticillium longisporum TaxID=100787 RepID=A0A0G4KXV9_VERLO|nr:hypothetical protein BN1723_010396 [Verticillium longisporum]
MLEKWVAAGNTEKVRPSTNGRCIDQPGGENGAHLTLCGQLSRLASGGGRTSEAMPEPGGERRAQFACRRRGTHTGYMWTAALGQLAPVIGWSCMRLRGMGMESNGWRATVFESEGTTISLRLAQGAFQEGTSDRERIW